MITFTDWLKIKTEGCGGGAFIVGGRPKKDNQFNVFGQGGTKSLPGYPIGTKQDRAENHKKKK